MNLAHKIGTVAGGNSTRIYGEATFMTMRLTANYGDFFFGGDFRSRVTGRPQPPPNGLLGKEFMSFIGGSFWARRPTSASSSPSSLSSPLAARAARCQRRRQ